jgi:alanine racemase
MLSKHVKKLIKIVSSNDYKPLNSVEINREKLLSNLQLIKGQNPNMGIIAVLKANAYGHGLVEVAQILNSGDCSFIAVDGYFEAAKIRDTTNHPILVMGYIRPENARLLDTKHCSFVVQDIESLHALGKLGKVVKVHVELNTGMNRLGLQPDELENYLSELKKWPKLQLEGIMTHLADADNEYDDSYTIKQSELFDKLVEQILKMSLRPKFIHIAQTAGSTKASSKYANSIRLGIGLYGINPLSEKDKKYSLFSELKPVLELKSTIIKTMDLKKSDRVSYNGIFVVKAPAKIAVLPLGYYEGVPRELSNKGEATYGNHSLAIAGRVCMNHTMIDISGTNLKKYDQVTLISSNSNLPSSIKQICKNQGLFSYSLLTGISSSIKRQII